MRYADVPSQARCAAACLFVLLCSAAANAQSRPVAFPQGAVSGTHGNWGPLGEDCLGRNLEARTHILIPAEYLPPRPAVAWALEHIPTWLTSPTIPNCPGLMTTVQYALLEVTMAHRPRGAGPLSLTFASNLPSPPPTPVFSQSWTKTWTIDAWDAIPFAQGFAYDGASDLVIAIRKVVTGSGQNVGTLRNLNSSRTDLPQQVMLVGVGASTATTAGSYGPSLGWRLRFDRAVDPTLEVRSPHALSGLHFEHGAAMHWRIFDTAGDFYALGAGLGFLPVVLSVPPVTGGLWLASPVVTVSLGIVAPASGTVFHRVDWTIPASPVLAGLRICGQAATMDLVTGLTDLTNAVDFVIQ
jgi:hypothetical protein